MLQNIPDAPSLWTVPGLRAKMRASFSQSPSWAACAALLWNSSSSRLYVFFLGGVGGDNMILGSWLRSGLKRGSGSGWSGGLLHTGRTCATAPAPGARMQLQAPLSWPARTQAAAHPDPPGRPNMHPRAGSREQIVCVSVEVWPHSCGYIRCGPSVFACYVAAVKRFKKTRCTRTNKAGA